MVATLAPRITQVTDDLLAAARPAAAELELVSQLAYPLPVRIISELLGVPAEDHSRFAGWSAKLAHSVQPSFGAIDQAELAAAEQAGLEFGEYFTELIAVRRSSPADDLLTKLIEAEDAKRAGEAGGDRLTVEELIATCVLLLVAGHETTVGLISNAMLALLRNPGQLAALVADPDLAASAVEETLRYDPPVQLTGRVARDGMAIGGFEPADGAVLLLLLAATGARPRRLRRSRRVRYQARRAESIWRSRAGPHFCLGAPLARLEATIALRAIAQRVAGPGLDESSLAYKPNFNLRGPEHMVVTFDEIRSPAGWLRHGQAGRSVRRTADCAQSVIGHSLTAPAVVRCITAVRRCQMIPIPVKSETPEKPESRELTAPGRSAKTRRALAGSGVRTGRVFRRAAALTALALAAAGCGSSGSPSGAGSSTPAAGHAGGTYTILANSAFGVADPAQNYTLEEWQLLIDTHDGLVQFLRVGGAPGTKMVPDLATSIPMPTDGGKTYLFHIRRGIKFSNGQVMKPSDFVKTFERQFTVPGPTSFYSGIVGAQQVQHQGMRPVARASSPTTQHYTLTIHLTAPDPEFLDKLVAAVRLRGARRAHPPSSPATTCRRAPARTCGSRITPTPRPCSSATSTSTSGAPRRQPAGYPNEIIEKYGQTVSDEVTAVENGQADEVFDGDVIPADRLNELNGPQFAKQVHVNALTADWYCALNTQQPPFNNLKARQAINFAADRNAYVKIGGGPSLAVPTCQILPPNFPGYKPYCPYTAGGGTSKWTGPDLAKAKALVKLRALPG